VFSILWGLRCASMFGISFGEPLAGSNDWNSSIPPAWVPGGQLYVEQARTCVDAQARSSSLVSRLPLSLRTCQEKVLRPCQHTASCRPFCRWSPPLRGAACACPPVTTQMTQMKETSKCVRNSSTLFTRIRNLGEALQKYRIPVNSLRQFRIPVETLNPGFAWLYCT